MRKKILFMSFLTFVGIIVGFCFGLKYNEFTWNKNNAEQVIEYYDEFIAGRKTAYVNREKSECITIEDIVGLLQGGKEQYYTKYVYFDVSGDDIPECHIKSNREYYIFTVSADEIYLWHSDYPQTCLLDNGHLLYTHISGANYYEYYTYKILNNQGEEYFEISFGRGDSNSDGHFAEGDYFLFDGVENLSCYNWLALTERYLSVGNEEVRWKDLVR